MAATGGMNTNDILKPDPKIALAVEKMLAREHAKTEKTELLLYISVLREIKVYSTLVDFNSH